jgi:hypothetical protein
VTRPDLGPEIPGATCPKCQATLDAATAADCSDAVPSAGDYSVCAYCGVYLQYVECDGALRLGWITPAEFAQLPQLVRDTLRRAKAAVAAVRDRHGMRQFDDVLVIGRPAGRKELN